MTTTYTTSLRLWEGQPGDPAIRNAWGTALNENQVLLESAILGSAIVNVAGLTAYTLTTANGAADQARPLIQSYTGALTAACTVTLPNVPKVGYAQNLTTGGFAVILTTGAGTTATIPSDGKWYLFSADGSANVILVDVGFGVLSSLTVSGVLTAETLTAGEITSQGAASLGALTTGSLAITNTVGILAAPAANTGNGTIGSLGALTGVRIGTYTITMGSATAFTVTDPQSVSVGSGVVGTPFATQIEFTLTAGSTAFAAGDAFNVTIQVAAVAGVGTAHGGNIGNGTIGAISLLTGFRIGTYVATFSSATAFIVTDPLGNVLGSGLAGSPFATQVGFTITAGATAFVAGDFFDVAVQPSTQIDGNVAVGGSVQAGVLVSTSNATVYDITYFGQSGEFYVNPNNGGNQLINFSAGNYLQFVPGTGFGLVTGGNFYITAGTVVVTGNVQAGDITATGGLNGAAVASASTLTAQGAISGQSTLTTVGTIETGQEFIPGTGFASKVGSSGGLTGNVFNIDWTGSAAVLWIDNDDLGIISTSSDRRIKKNIMPVIGGFLERNAALQVVTYEFAEVGIFKADGRMHLGFVAQDVQKVVPSAVNGDPTAVKEDGTPKPQSLNPLPLIAENTGAIQELMDLVRSLQARILVLEGKP